MNTELHLLKEESAGAKNAVQCRFLTAFGFVLLCSFLLFTKTYARFRPHFYYPL